MKDSVNYFIFTDKDPVYSHSDVVVINGCVFRGNKIVQKDGFLHEWLQDMWSCDSPIRFQISERIGLPFNKYL